LLGELPAEVVAAAIERGKGANLEVIVRDLLGAG